MGNLKKICKKSAMLGHGKMRGKAEEEEAATASFRPLESVCFNFDLGICEKFGQES